MTEFGKLLAAATSARCLLGCFAACLLLGVLAVPSTSARPDGWRDDVQQPPLDRRRTFAPAQKASAGVEVNELFCDEKYHRFSETHSACARRSPAVLREGLDESAKRLVVAAHNRYRSQVDRYQQPAAANMQRMYWDDELALVAQKWASHCYWEHDASVDRAIPGAYAVGQNLARGHQNWSLVVTHWHSEYKNFRFKDQASRKPFGHYTQVVWAESARIGCGHALCNGSQDFYVCNYAPTGNHIFRQLEPYKIGAPGSDCRRTFKDGLCDCGGMVCKNGGILDLNTCSCTCPKLPWIGGPDCSIDCNKAADAANCHSRGGTWTKEACKNYINFPSEFCPIMCGVCPDKSLGSRHKISEASEKNGYEKLLELLGLSHEKAARSGSGVGGGSWEAAGLPVILTEATAVHVDNRHRQNQPRKQLATTAQVASSTTLSATDSKVGETIAACQVPDHPRCGQPSPAASYYTSASCTGSSSVQSSCPAMCGRCSATSCRTHDGRVYREGMTWLTEYGTHRCTRQGAVVTRGCFVAELDLYMPKNASGQFIKRESHYDCDCSSNFVLKCSVRICTDAATSVGMHRARTSCEFRWLTAG